MSVPDPTWEPPVAPPAVCPLCETANAPTAERCHACGLFLAVAPERPSPFDARALWILMGAIAVVYAVTLVIVALIR